MERNLRIERTYYLGQYKNIKIEDTIVGIPEEQALNTDVIDAVVDMMLANIDKAFYKYIKNSSTFHAEISYEEAMEIMKKVSDETTEELQEAFAEKQKE